MKPDKMTNHTSESLKKGTITGFKGIFIISEFNSRPLKPIVFRISLAASIIFCSSIYIFRISPFEAIGEITSLSMGFLPCILGFTIGGYGFLIGFVQPNLMDKISEPRDESVFSLFQLASASFACNILIQGMSLCFAYFIHAISWIDQKGAISPHLPSLYIDIVNGIGLVVISISFTVSVSVVLQLIVNVFNFSQLHHYNHNKTKFDKKQKVLQSEDTTDNSPSSGEI